MDEEFKPGIYRHYKGGMYTALQIVKHHETGEKFVMYVSHTHGSVHIREWRTPGTDSWTDFVEVQTARGRELASDNHKRFQYVGPA